MPPKFTAGQHAIIAKRARHKEHGPDDGGGDNIKFVALAVAGGSRAIVTEG